jgi:UDP-galactopyranose mutase
MNILVVGAGFSGSTVARILADKGHTVTVIDQRDHVGGNAFDYVNDKGITVHKYGPHLFHTNNKQVYDWLSRFTEWVPYEHKAKALLANGSMVPFPVNDNTLDVVDQQDVHSIFFEPYSKKMWGKYYPDISKDVADRVRVKNNRDDRYFSDLYQVMPAQGYTKMFETMLNHPNISVKLNKTFEHDMESLYDHTFNSMSIDHYYDYKHGKLPYRSIKFTDITLPIDKVFPVATVNFTDNDKYTRVTEWKNIANHGDNHSFTSLTFEQPCEDDENNGERYYPVMTDQNKSLYYMYKQIPNDKVTFIGRCGLYAYLDMHMAVSSSLSVVNKFLNSID